MDYLKERLPLISEENPGKDDIKKFKGKLIDTMCLHYDNLITNDRLRKLQMEMDQCVLEASPAKFNKIGPIVLYVFLSSIYSFPMWMASITDIRAYLPLHFISFVTAVFMTYIFKKDFDTLIALYVFLSSIYSFPKWMASITDIRAYLPLHFISFVTAVFMTYIFEKGFDTLQDTFASKMNEMKDICDVLIHLNNKA